MGAVTADELPELPAWHEEAAGWNWAAVVAASTSLPKAIQEQGPP